MLLGKGKNPATVRWSIRDRKLFAAAMRLQDEKCPQCGVPAWLGQTYSSKVEFEVGFAICHGCESKDEATKDLKMKPGEFAHVHAVPVVDEDGATDGLPSRAEGYSKIDTPVYASADD